MAVTGNQYRLVADTWLTGGGLSTALDKPHSGSGNPNYAAALWFCGGLNGSGNSVSAVQKGIAGTWSADIALPAIRRTAALSVQGGFMYHHCGFDGTNYQSTTYRFNTGSWSSTTTAPVISNYNSASVFDFAGLVVHTIGSTVGDNPIDFNHSFSRAETYTSIGTAGLIAMYAAIAQVGSLAFKLCGQTNAPIASATNVNVQWNGVSWSSASASPAARTQMANASRQTYFSLVGGFDASSNRTNNNQTFNGTSWSQRSALPANTVTAVGGSI